MIREGFIKKRTEHNHSYAPTATTTPHPPAEAANTPSSPRSPREWGDLSRTQRGSLSCRTRGRGCRSPSRSYSCIHSKNCSRMCLLRAGTRKAVVTRFEVVVLVLFGPGVVTAPARLRATHPGKGRSSSLLLEALRTTSLCQSSVVMDRRAVPRQRFGVRRS